MKPSCWQQLDRQLQHACQQRLFSGAALAVFRPMVVAHEIYLGTTRYGVEGRAINSDTYFDLASLTKVLAVGSVVSWALQRQQLSLSQDFSDLGLSWQPYGQTIDLRHLLCHQAGFAAWLDFCSILPPDLLAQCQSQPGSVALNKAIAQHLQELPCDYQPGTITRYSDVGYVFLSSVLSVLLGQPWSSLVAQVFDDQLDIDRVVFKPLEQGVDRLDICATQDCSDRGGVLQGQVHDHNAFVLGGVAGHAGLFAPLDSVVKFGQQWLKSLTGEPSAIDSRIAHAMVQPHYALDGSSRGLAWDLPQQPSCAGTLISNCGIGHLGYTGTSLWLDLERRAGVVLLTNRVHPRDDQHKTMKQFRADIHDCIWRELN